MANIFKISLYFLLFFCTFFKVNASDCTVISPQLLQLLEIMQVPHNGTLQSIVTASQNQWYRQHGKERWELSDIDEDKKTIVLELAKELGFIDQIVPRNCYYDYGIILGGTVQKMQQRIDALIDLWQAGLRFQHIVFLSGQRPINPSVEPQSPAYHTESQAIHYLWYIASMPNELKSIPVQFIDVDMYIKNGILIRPNLTDTINAWVAEKPAYGSCLFISSQPYCRPQHAAIKCYLPECYPFETIGVKTEQKHGGIILDAIANWLYYELQFQNKAANAALL